MCNWIKIAQLYMKMICLDASVVPPFLISIFVLWNTVCAKHSPYTSAQPRRGGWLLKCSEFNSGHWILPPPWVWWKIKLLGGQCLIVINFRQNYCKSLQISSEKSLAVKNLSYLSSLFFHMLKGWLCCASYGHFNTGRPLLDLAAFVHTTFTPPSPPPSKNVQHFLREVIIWTSVSAL